MSAASNAKTVPEVSDQLVVQDPEESPDDEAGEQEIRETTAEPASKKQKTAAKKSKPAAGNPDEEEAGKTDAKKTKGVKADKPAKAEKGKGGKSKRGPARPYRKLPQEILDLRIQKLQKRIDRTSAQAEEGRNFLTKYTREQAFRASEASAE